MEAIDQNKLLFVKCLLDAGANPNKIRDPKTRELTEADVPLQEATTISASHNDLSMVRLLLDYGANPNYRNDRMHYDSDGPQGRWDGISPLVAAAESGEFAIAELLLERGADPCLIRTDGAAPYDIALKAGHREIARLIMARMTSASCVIGNLSKPGSSR
jgi:ankyrin repeat protein